jgi:hypothetical protein
MSDTIKLMEIARDFTIAIMGLDPTWSEGNTGDISDRAITLFKKMIDEVKKLAPKS